MSPRWSRLTHMTLKSAGADPRGRLIGSLSTDYRTYKSIVKRNELNFLNHRSLPVTDFDSILGTNNNIYKIFMS